MPETGLIPRVCFPHPRDTGYAVRSALTRGSNLRPLRIVIDRKSVTDGEALEVLLGFVHHEAVEVVTTNPKDGGWLLEIGEQNRASDHAPVILHRGRTGTTRSSIRSLRSIENVARTMPGSATANRSALILACAASSVHADALATRNPRILDPSTAWIRRDNAMTPEEAVALMGLNLRLRGDFTYFQTGDFDRGETGSEGFDRGLYYWVLTRTLLSAAWRWFGACVSSSAATGDDNLLGLGGSALIRFDRALRARDRVHEQFQVPQDNNTADEAHFYLDLPLVQLVGLFDVVARVATSLISCPETRAGSPGGAGAVARGVPSSHNAIRV